MLIDILMYIAFGFLCLQFINTLINSIFRQSISRNSRTNRFLLSVLIPARNEEQNIGRLLQLLLKVTNQPIEIIVCNDQSTDKTQEIIDNYSQISDRIRSFESAPLPANWLGKNYACYQLAQQASGKYYLFLDADVIIDPTVLKDCINYLIKYELGLLSIFPKQLMITKGEILSIPLMNYILLTLLPLIFVRISPFSSHAAANGQFMLFDADIYKREQPHNEFKTSAVEDIAIARSYKRKKIKIACLTGERRIQCRMYHSYTDSLNGFSKNIFMFFGNSKLFAFLFWFFATFGIVFVAISNYQLLWGYLNFMLITQVLYALASKQDIGLTIIGFPIHLIFMFQVMCKAIYSKNKKNYQWKGRNIYS